MSRELLRLITTVAWGCVSVGLFSVVLARGCESLGERKVARLEAAARLEADEIWQQTRATVAAELDGLQKKGRLAPAEQERFRELGQSLKQLDDGRNSEELAAVQRLGVNRAMAEFRAAAFVRGIALYGGVVFLSLGSLALAILGTASDRWLGIAMILVVCYAALTESG
jgi:hypothetical protein